MGYYRVSLRRKRQAIASVGSLATNAAGKPSPFSSPLAYERASVSVPFGNCTEPSNLKAGGGACPIRFQCAGCSFYRPDPSYVPAIEEHVASLRADRETARAVEAADYVIATWTPRSTPSPGWPSRCVGGWASWVTTSVARSRRPAGSCAELELPGASPSSPSPTPGEPGPHAVGPHGGAAGRSGPRQRRQAAASAGGRRHPGAGGDTSHPRRGGQGRRRLQLAGLRRRCARARGSCPTAPGRDRLPRPGTGSLAVEHRATPAGLRPDLAVAREEIRRLRAERDGLRQRLRLQLGAEIEGPERAELIGRVADLEALNRHLVAERDARGAEAVCCRPPGAGARRRPHRGPREPPPGHPGRQPLKPAPRA